MTTVKQFNGVFGPMLGEPVLPCPLNGVVVVTLQYGVGDAPHDVEVALENSVGYDRRRSVTADRSVFTVNDEYLGEVLLRSTSGLWAPRGGLEYMCECSPKHHTHVVVPLAQPELYFARGDTHERVTALSLPQGEMKPIEVRCTHRLGGRFKVELGYPGAAAKLRPSTRSVTDATYRYLSRVRLAEDPEGIERPIHEPRKGPPLDLPCTSGRWDTKLASPYLALKAMTVVGLECGAGDEVLEARLVDRDGTVWATARLTVSVTAPSKGRAAYRLFDHRNVDDFKSDDEDFTRIFAKASAPADAVKIGVCDTGIFDDSTGGQYLRPRIVGGSFFSTDLVEEGRVPNEGGLARLFSVAPSKHGTNVAAQAAWGSARIKLLDVMVQKGQTLGDMNGALTQRAFEWAGAQGAAVVNCSKVMYFNTTEGQAALERYPETLFLATGGNTAACFPFNYGALAANDAIRKAFKADCGIEGLPRVFTNTLLVGGHDKGPRHHASRGYGPGVDVMVYSDEMTLYTPRALVETFRLPSIDKLRRETLARLDQTATSLEDAEPTVSGELPMIKVHKYNTLKRLKELHDLGQDGGQYTESNRREFEQLEQMKQARPNPEYLKRQVYLKTAALFRAMPWPGGTLASGRDNVVKWLESFIDFASITKAPHVVDSQLSQAWPATPWGEVKGTDAKQRFDLAESFYQDIKKQNLELILRELRKSEDGLSVAVDNGVSFGLPVVANTAAKLKLLRGALTGKQLRRLLIDTSDYTPGFESECLAQGVVNPLRAYFAAYDGDVENGGTCPRSTPPKADSSLTADRRVYYTFFVMNPQGRSLCDALRGDLKAAFRKMNVDLIEAEPPVTIPDEPVTYVTDSNIGGHDWRKVVNQALPLVHAPRHLRAVLVNQCAHVEKAKEIHTCAWQSPTWVAANDEEHQFFGNTLPKYSMVSSVVGDQSTWSCTITIRKPATRRVFPPTLAHIVDRARVGPAQTGTLLTPEQFTVTRVSATEIRFTITDQAAAASAQGKDVTVEVRVLAELGGSADKNNIFLNAGATDTTLVLLLHEIGHAIGLVPSTHAKHYTNNEGGQGHHCSHNTELVSNADATRLYNLPGDGTSHVRVPVGVITPSRLGGEPPCVMYHTRSSAHGKSVFCSVCVQTVKDADGASWKW